MRGQVGSCRIKVNGYYQKIKAACSASSRELQLAEKCQGRHNSPA